MSLYRGKNRCNLYKNLPITASRGSPLAVSEIGSVNKSRATTVLSIYHSLGDRLLSGVRAAERNRVPGVEANEVLPVSFRQPRTNGTDRKSRSSWHCRLMSVITSRRAVRGRKVNQYSYVDPGIKILARLSESICAMPPSGRAFGQ